jgi:hypothetical protein
MCRCCAAFPPPPPPAVWPADDCRRLLPPWRPLLVAKHQREKASSNAMRVAAAPNPHITARIIPSRVVLSGAAGDSAGASTATPSPAAWAALAVDLSGAGELSSNRLGLCVIRSCWLTTPDAAVAETSGSAAP